MKIFSLPKYNMTLKQWGEIIFWLISIILFCCVVRDCTVALKKDQERDLETYAMCQEVCYPNPVWDYRLGPNGECKCNTGVEYR